MSAFMENDLIRSQNLIVKEEYMNLLTLACTLSILTVPYLYAQETTASGNLMNQMSWNALKNLAEQANNNANIAKIAAIDAQARALKIETCGNSSMLYAPQSLKKDPNGCIPIELPTSLDMFTIRLGADAGKSIKIQYNLSKGTYSILTKNYHGKAYVIIPKLDSTLLCGTTQRKIELLTMGPWYGMTLAKGHQIDPSLQVASHQLPSCSNGLVGIAEVYDTSGPNENDEWSLSGILMMKAQ
jgi:hypothetical protein